MTTTIEPSFAPLAPLRLPTVEALAHPIFRLHSIDPAIAARVWLLQIALWAATVDAAGAQRRRTVLGLLDRCGVRLTSTECVIRFTPAFGRY
jgi:hypothetical protein